MLSVAYILVERVGLSQAEIRVLEVPVKPEQIREITAWTLGILWSSLLVHWIGDLVSLASWNSSLRVKSTSQSINSDGKLRSEMEHILRDCRAFLERQQNDAAPNKDISYIVNSLDSLNKSGWWYEKTAVLYVVVWSFLIPTGFAFWCAYLLLDA